MQDSSAMEIEFSKYFIGIQNKLKSRKKLVFANGFKKLVRAGKNLKFSLGIQKVEKFELLKFRLF